MVTAILMMAGNATRMHSQENKVYLPLGNQMVFEHSLQLFLSFSMQVICVIRKEDRHFLKDYESKVSIVYGGKTRQESVYNGLREVKTPYVLIHDAARPFISHSIIENCILSLRQGKAFLVVQPCKDSIYQTQPLKAIARDTVVLAQTPQGGRAKDVLQAHQQAIQNQDMVTDDISLLLKYTDAEVELIEGADSNFKITTQLDYITAKELLKHV